MCLFLFDFWLFCFFPPPLAVGFLPPFFAPALRGIYLIFNDLCSCFSFFSAVFVPFSAVLYFGFAQDKFWACFWAFSGFLFLVFGFFFGCFFVLFFAFFGGFSGLFFAPPTPQKRLFAKGLKKKRKRAEKRAQSAENQKDKPKK